MSENVNRRKPYSNKEAIKALIPNKIKVADAITFSGCSLAIDGTRRFFNGQKILGLTEGLLGESFDFFDGKVARWLGEDSEQGAAYDAFCDKIKKGYEIPVLTKNGTIPLWYGVSTFAVQSAIFKCNYDAGMNGEDVKTIPQGKRSMAEINAAIGFYCLSDTLKDHNLPRVSRCVKIAAYAVSALSLAESTQALMIYKENRKKYQSNSLEEF
jgi:phosphatidylglycerophosphate synthase